MVDRNYFSTSRPDSLATAATGVATQLVLADGSTFPDPALTGGRPYTVIVGYGTDREEVCTVTAKPTATTLTVIRGEDGTAASAKNAGDTVVHGVSARDFKALDEKVDRAGDTMTGPLILSGDAVDDLGAATKQQMGAADDVVRADLEADLALKAPLASPALTGNPTAPTQATNNNSTRLATTAFVNAEIAADAPTKTGGGASGTWPIGVSGNAATADKLKTARNIALSGDASGSVNFDGSGNVSIPVVVADDSHNHVIDNVDDLQTALNGKAAASHNHDAGNLTSGTVNAARLPFRYGRPNTAFPIGADASTGNITIPHGLGRMPVAVIVSPDDDGGDCSVFASVESFDAINIYAQMRNVGAAETHVYINWIAF